MTTLSLAADSDWPPGADDDWRRPGQAGRNLDAPAGDRYPEPTPPDDIAHPRPALGQSRQRWRPDGIDGIDGIGGGQPPLSRRGDRDANPPNSATSPTDLRKHGGSR
jgi:hypothetical protein